MLLYSDAKEADCGAGPWGVERDAEDSFYYLTVGAVRDPQGRKYPIGKTAYRTARKLNETGGIVAGLDLSGTREEVLARYPDPVVADPKPKRIRTRKDGKLVVPKHGAAADPSPTASFNGTREQWLEAFVTAARPMFIARGYTIPDKVRVSVGFAHQTRGGKVIGQCWSDAASGDGTHEIFVTPTLDDSSRMADVITHELCHAVVGIDAKHGPKFKQCATAMGLEGKMTATTAGESWHEWADPILKDLGPIPHAALNAERSGIKKQTTRLLKAECDMCQLTFRITAKWANGRELICPDIDCEGRMCVELPDGEG